MIVVPLYHGVEGWLAAVVVAWRGGVFMARAQVVATGWVRSRRHV